MRFALVKSVCTGKIQLTPISVAFSTIKSVRDFLIGANINQRFGGSCKRCVCKVHFTIPFRFPATITSARHSPSSVPLNSSIAAPTESRITPKR